MFNRILTMAFSVLFTSGAFASQSLCNGALGIVQVEDAQFEAGLQGALSVLKAFDRGMNLPKASLSGVYRRQEIFRQAEFFDGIGSDPARIESLYKSWYGNSAPGFEAFAKCLESRLLALALDPGIVNRADEFIRFANADLKSLPQTSLIDLRRRFSQSLGMRRIFRGLSLSKSQLQRILKEGIQPRALTFQVYKPDIYPELDSPYQPKNRLEEELVSWGRFLLNGPKNDMFNRINSGGNDSFSQSASAFQEVAVYASRNFGRPGQDVYVFELEIPAIDVIEAAQVTDQMGHASFRSMGKRFYMDQPGVEVFILGHIPAAWIKSHMKMAATSGKTQFVENGN
jgi:hypothetical protein